MQARVAQICPLDAIVRVEHLFSSGPGRWARAYRREGADVDVARARNIKPGYFRNELLAELTPLARLLFAGLWTVADRAGRLEDRPRRIKADVLPYDDCDVDGLLDDLERGGFVRRYEVAGERYIEVVTFGRHQNPHKNEAPSTIPAPEEEGSASRNETEPQTSARADTPIPDSGQRNPEGGAGTGAGTVATGAPALERRGRARRLPGSFEVTDAMRAWARKETGLADEVIDAETEKFRDHFAGSGSAKVDWAATWRNWLRKAVEYRARREPPGRRDEERPWLATPGRERPFDFFETKPSA